MPIQVNCQHKSVKLDNDEFVIRCTECGKVLDIKNVDEQIIIQLLKKLPDYNLVHREPACVSCYSPVQFRPNYPEFKQKSGCSISFGHIVILVIIAGLILYLIFHFIF
jgi:hypothetical protein